MNSLNHQYLRREHLKGLDQYKYNAIDTSPVSLYIMHPFWNWLVEYFPHWLAPNLMTLLGFLLLVVNFVLFSIYDFHFTETLSLPRWIWLVAGLCQFWSHQLDGMDGKQARRTKSSSALGELFDHGIDSWASFLFPICIFSVISKNEYGFSTLAMHLLLISIYMTFITTHWEKYNTKILFLPWAYDISMLIMTATYLISFMCTPAIFHFNIPILNISFSLLIQYVWPLFGILSSIPISIINILESYRTGQGYNRTFIEAVRPLISPAILFIASTWWALLSPNEILDKQPRLFMTAVGTTFSNIACRLIVAQMTSTRSDGVNKLLFIYVPILLICVHGNVSETTESIALYLYNLVVTILHLHYACCVVRQICDHLGIRAFKIVDRSNDTSPTKPHKH